MSFFVEPGESFYVTYVSDGETVDFPVPDVAANTSGVSLFVNGLIQIPVIHYTVHQGTLSLAQGPLPESYTLLIRNS